VGYLPFCSYITLSIVGPDYYGCLMKILLTRIVSIYRNAGLEANQPLCPASYSTHHDNNIVLKLTHTLFLGRFAPRSSRAIHHSYRPWTICTAVPWTINLDCRWTVMIPRLCANYVLCHMHLRNCMSRLKMTIYAIDRSCYALSIDRSARSTGRATLSVDQSLAQQSVNRTRISR